MASTRAQVYQLVHRLTRLNQPLPCIQKPSEPGVSCSYSVVHAGKSPAGSSPRAAMASMQATCTSLHPAFGNASIGYEVPLAGGPQGLASSGAAAALQGGRRSPDCMVSLSEVMNGSDLVNDSSMGSLTFGMAMDSRYSPPFIRAETQPPQPHVAQPGLQSSSSASRLQGCGEQGPPGLSGHQQQQQQQELLERQQPGGAQVQETGSPGSPSPKPKPEVSADAAHQPYTSPPGSSLPPVQYNLPHHHHRRCSPCHSNQHSPHHSPHQRLQHSQTYNLSPEHQRQRSGSPRPQQRRHRHSRHSHSPEQALRPGHRQSQSTEQARRLSQCTCSTRVSCDCNNSQLSNWGDEQGLWEGRDGADWDACSSFSIFSYDSRATPTQLNLMLSGSHVQEGQTSWHTGATSQLQ